MTWTVGFTGHRPNGLGTNLTGKLYTGLRAVAREYMLAQKPDRVISGMAVGWDFAVALTGIELNIPVVAAVPFKGYEKRMCELDRNRFNELLEQCDEVHYICDPGWASSKMHHRNRWIVVNSDRICALWNGGPSGTSNCVNYAKRVGKPIDNLWDKWKSLYMEQPT